MIRFRIAVILSCAYVVMCRYAIDVNLERADDVLTHKRLLHLARDPANRPAFDVRLVQVTFSISHLI